MPILPEGWKEDPGNCSPVSLTPMPGQVLEQVILSAIKQHMQDNQGTRHSQHRLLFATSFTMRGRC